MQQIVKQLEDKILAFRQPLVTATGIILGFILNFASSWVKSESQLSDTLAYIVGICILVGIVCLIIALGRILRLNYPRETAEIYYRKTLNYLITGVSIAFFGVMIDMYGNFMS